MKLGYIYGSKIKGNVDLGVDPYTGLDASLTVPGDLTVTGDFTFGNAVLDTLIVNGRVATGSIAGAALDIDATYTYDAAIEFRADVSSWVGIAGTDFYGMYMRISASVDSAADNLYAEQIYAANGLPGEDGVDMAMLSSAIFNTMGKGTSTITLMRGIEVKCEWLATDTVTDARALQIEFMGLAAPTNTIYGIYFEKESAAGAMVPFFQEIRMKEGPVIMSSTADPEGVVTAPTGSLCLVTNGTTTNDSLWINRGGGTVWKYVTVEA